MCGRFASFLPPEALRAIFRTVNPLPNAEASWNLAPAQDAFMVRRHPDTGERHLDRLRWGLVPYFTKDLKTAPRPINARSETAASSGMFRDALLRRRGLVPADAFFEWHATPAGKEAYAIARQDGTPLAFAGIWESWRSLEGARLRTFAILTTAANAFMRQLHDRMPVILEPDDWPLWLGEADGDPRRLLRPAGEDVLHFWRVSPAVNSVRNNGPELLDRIDDLQAAPPRDSPPGDNPE